MTSLSAEGAHPEIKFVIADGPSPGSWTGLAGMAEGFRDFAGPWQEYRVEADEYHELEGDRVLVLVPLGGRGKTSGLELGQMQAKGAALLHLRAGKVTRFVLYNDRQCAFADLGLSTGTSAPGP